MVIVTRRICGKTAVHGISHAALAGLAAAAAGAAAGLAISMAAPVHHKLEAFGLAVPAACGATIVFGVVAYLLDKRDLSAVLAWTKRAPGARSQKGGGLKLPYQEQSQGRPGPQNPRARSEPVG
jgi:hypothetical protein